MRIRVSLDVEVDLDELKKALQKTSLNNGDVIEYVKNEIVNNNLEGAQFFDARDNDTRTHSREKGFLSILLGKYNK